MDRELVIVGVTHRSAPVEVRESLAFDKGDLATALTQLRQLPSVDEAVLISTCNRVEVVATAEHGDTAIDEVTQFLAEHEGSGDVGLLDHLTVCRGREAVRHLFRVAASLDSMVVGEPQILGQLKDFYAQAAATGSAGVVLHRGFHKAFAVAKRVRSETGIASRAVSVSSAAVELASKIFDHLSDKTAMLIGAGMMGELAARHLLGHGVRHLLVTNRTFDNAVQLAREFNGTAVPFNELSRHLETADVVIGSTAAEGYVLTTAILRPVLRQRKYRPIFLIDLSVPRNFDPALNQLDNVYLYDIDDLGAITEENRQERGREADKAEEIVDAEVDAFMRWLSELDAVPTIVAIRDKVEAIRRAELERTLATMPELSARDRETLDAMTGAIVNKILHSPITHLKQQGRQRESLYLVAARHLFDLDNDKGPEQT